MNNIPELPIIKSYEDLILERQRLQELINHQKNIIRQDLDDIKAELKQELKPAVDAANFVKKFTNRETRNENVLSLTSNVVLDIVIRKLFSKSGFLIQLFLPTLLKNFSANTLAGMIKTIATKKRGHNGLNGSHLDHTRHTH